MYTIHFNDGEIIKGLREWEDCLTAVQSRESTKYADWKSPVWEDGLPPLSCQLFFDPDTGKTVATVFYDYK